MFTWNPDIKLGDILTFVALLFTGVTVLYARKTLLQNIRVQRAEFLLKLTERYFKDDDVRKFYYKVDWHEYKFDRANFALSGEEPLLDKLLYSFDEIGETLRLGVLSEEQARIFAFQAARLLDNEDVQAYLEMLDGHYEAEGLEMSHPGARYLVDKLVRK